MDPNKNTILVHSLNVNGLTRKLNKVKDFIKLHKIDILLLQEVHKCDEQLVERFFEEHNLLIKINKIINQHNNFNGTAIVFNKSITLNYDVQIQILEDNRLQKAVLSNSEHGNILLYNTYFRTGSGSYVIKQRCKTIDLIEKDLKTLSYCNVFIGGDFNFVTNILDSNCDIDENSLDVNRWLHFVNSFNFFDSFRELYGNDRVYTKITNGRITRRIDRIYSNSKVLDYTHIPIPHTFSDHCFSPGVMFHGSKFVKWGPGSWKVNSTLFTTNNIKTVNHMWSTFRAFDGNDNILVWWDSMKYRLKKFYSIKGMIESKRKRLNLNKKEKEIQEMVNYLNPEQLDNSERYRQLNKRSWNMKSLKFNNFACRTELII